MISKNQYQRFKLLRKLLFGTGISLILTVNTAQAQQPNPTPNEPNQRVDLTEIVVTALVLSFGYGVLKSFQKRK